MKQLRANYASLFRLSRVYTLSVREQWRNRAHQTAMQKVCRSSNETSKLLNKTSFKTLKEKRGYVIKYSLETLFMAIFKRRSGRARNVQNSAQLATSALNRRISIMGYIRMRCKQKENNYIQYTD